MSARRDLLTFVGLTVLGLSLVIGASQLAPAEPREPFNAELKRRLEQLKPEFVLLGNSMVKTRFSEPDLARLLSPHRIAVVGPGGSKSAYWYLALKNVILPATQPRRILLFYRRRELTSPRDRVLGAEHHRLDPVAREDDPFVEQLISPRRDQPVERLGWMLGRLAPVGRLHALVTPHLDAFATSAATLAVGGRGREPSKRALESVFTLGKLRSSDIEPALGGTERGTFEQTLAGSFLPAIVELAKGAGVKLTFIRIRTRPDASTKTPKARRRGGYDDMLERYVRGHGAEHLDMTRDEWETLSLYGEGDHIAPRHRKRYTALFVEHHRDVFH